VATNVSTPQADTECPSANMKYSCLRYKKQEKFAPYIPIAKARGFTALSGNFSERFFCLGLTSSFYFGSIIGLKYYED
jgi:hypothetical protein